MFLCARFACAPQLLAGVCGVGWYALDGVSAAPCLSLLGCWGVCVCLCACSACTQPLLVGVCGVKPVRTPVAIFGSLGVCIYVPASRHWLISYAPIYLT